MVCKKNLYVNVNRLFHTYVYFMYPCVNRIYLNQYTIEKILVLVCDKSFKYFNINTSITCALIAKTKNYNLHISRYVIIIPNCGRKWNICTSIISEI